ncbi:MAG: glycosyltransferase family 2 protein [Gemmatimonadetes bacterium]|nr:glycosyltransferase family 2 protein [Gemmatimonadota bacterium]MYH20040.1 glycosyltransferase family 2 protein [Gemmatimonadota bacterium]
MNPTEPHVTIVILNWNREADTLECLDSLARMNYPSFSIVVVDNGSTDGSPEAIERWGCEHLPLTLIRNGENLGFVRGSNQGMRHAISTDTDYVFLLNNDTVVEPDALSLLVATAERSGERSGDTGMAGPKIYQYGKDNVLDSAGTRAIWWLAQGFLIGHGEDDRGQYDHPGEMPYVTGTALLVKRAVLEKIGLMDEDYFCYFDDFDWGLKARKAGYRLLLVPEAVVHHKGSLTAGFGSPFYVHQRIRGQIVFARKHISILPFLFAFLPYLFLYRYLRPAALLIIRRRWLHLHALHRGIGEGFTSPISQPGLDSNQSDEVQGT